VETVRLPPQSPNLNAHAERFVRTIKKACLNRLIVVVSVRYDERSASSSRMIITSAIIRAWAIACFSPPALTREVMTRRLP
jgi:hypothetical protein